MKPNIIIINPDQMRADGMGHLGNPAAHTPNLDALAAVGVSFSSAYCQSPVCVPSRCSFFTGLYPHTNGHRTMGHLMRPHEENLFGDMKKAGYYTVSSDRGDLMAGQYPKYHKKLIDEYLRYKWPSKPIKHFNPALGEPESEGYYSFLNGIIPAKQPDGTARNTDDLTVRAAIRAIKKRPKNKPFFVFTGLFYPHPPYQIEKKYYDLIDKSKLPERIPNIKDADGKPLMERGLIDGMRAGEWGEERVNEIRAVYLAMCAKVDEQVGQIIEALKSEGIYDNTAVLFFSDHGDYTGDFGLVEKAQNCFPECLVNVPLLIKPPKNTPLDSGVNDSLAELTDICATVADMAGISIERSHFSKSLLPTMADKAVPHREYVCCEGGRLPGEAHCSEYENINPRDRYYPRLKLQSCENGEHTKAVMLRTKRYKYIRRLQETDEFYDMEKDERFNLINSPEYARQIKETETLMLDLFISTCDAVPADIDERTPREYLWNNITALGLPPFTGKLLTGLISLTGKTVSGFLNMIKKKFIKE